jgi:hypothetical protein
MAREEFGISNSPKKPDERFFTSYFDTSNGFTFVVDGNDPTTSILYLRLYKCANNQIRTYLNNHFNQREIVWRSQKEGRKNIRAFNSNERTKKVRAARKTGKKYATGNARRTSARTRRVADFDGVDGAYGFDTNIGRRRRMQEYANETAGQDETHRRLSLVQKHFHSSLNYSRIDIGGNRWMSRLLDITPETEEYDWFHQPSMSSRSKNNPPAGDKAYFRREGISYDKPCLFTVMRDPISHFLSGYNEIEFRLKTETSVYRKFNCRRKGRRSSSKQCLSFTDIGFDSQSKTAKDRELRETRFSEFVKNLLEGMDNHAIEPDQRDFFSHVYPLTRGLHSLQRFDVLPPADVGFDQWILPSVSNLKDTLPDFLAKRCPDFAANYQRSTGKRGLPDLEIAAVHKSASDPFGTYDAAKTVWKEGGVVARTLCYLHAMDYGCFYGNASHMQSQSHESGRQPAPFLGADHIPSICRHAYSREFFWKRILG